jgi:hypothetical protein
MSVIMGLRVILHTELGVRFVVYLSLPIFTWPKLQFCCFKFCENNLHEICIFFTRLLKYIISGPQVRCFQYCYSLMNSHLYCVIVTDCKDKVFLVLNKLGRMPWRCDGITPSFLTLALDVCECSTSHSCGFTLDERTPSTGCKKWKSTKLERPQVT